MNKGFDPKEIQAIKDKCAKKNKSFILREGKDSLQEEGANFLFVGEYEGKEVIIDAFLYTLEMEFFSEVIDDAIELVKEEKPKFKDADFDVLDGEHIDFMEEIADKLAEDDDYKVQEFIDFDDDCDYGVAMDACLNIPEVNEAEIEKFVIAYKSGSLTLDKTFYAFSIS
ncbi:MAG: hypothetical protein KTR26_02775 [Flammeovirgaceae bacterium]|nr:hypothetical protein [Flammeovirgaceae bacterium]